MPKSSTPPARAPDPGGLRPELRGLVHHLAALPAALRAQVVAAAEQEAGEERGTVPWEALEGARGAVRLGGNAVEDCDQLYDGT